MYKRGDLLQLKNDLIIRSDGVGLNQAEAEKEGGIRRDWLVGADLLPKGTFCTYMCDSEEAGRIIVSKSGFGRIMDVGTEDFELVASIDDAVPHEVEELEIDCSDL